MDGMEYQLIEAVFEAKHSLHWVIHFAKVPRGTFAALFLIDQMNREPQQERAMPGVTVSHAQRSASQFPPGGHTAD